MRLAAKQSVAPWLLLSFSLPTSRASQRVEVWRKLQRFGAVTLGNSGYLLPNDPINRERFEWLATVIRNYRGEASVVEVQSIDNLSTGQLVRRFAEARARDYQALIRDLRNKVISVPPQKRSTRLSRIRQRFQEIVAIDFFQSPLRGRVEELLERAASTGSPATITAEFEKVSRRDFQGKLWVTRLRPGVDRVSSAWLIRRFIDPKARFAFADEGGVPPGAVPFDMFQGRGGFAHRGEDCTFETLQKCFRIGNRKVSVLAQIVHDADLCDEKFGRREGFGIDEVLNGWDRQGLADREILERGLQMVEGLYYSLP
ncbi:MAG: chromate resistance protein [Acidobacteria bacterium]|nr:chromate resistance protein [Acidobacteriota bacterium]